MISAGINKKQLSKNNNANNNHSKSLLICIPDLERLVPGPCSCAGSNKWCQLGSRSQEPGPLTPVLTLQTGYPLRLQRCLIWKYNLKSVDLEKNITKNCICSSPRQNCWRYIKQWNTLDFMLSGTNACLSVSCMRISSTYHLWRVHPPNFLGCVARDWLFSPEQVFQTKKIQEVTGKSKSMKYAWQSPWLDDMTFRQSKSHQRNDLSPYRPYLFKTYSNEKLSMPGANISSHD
jgi:hypothetical protein